MAAVVDFDHNGKIEQLSFAIRGKLPLIEQSVFDELNYNNNESPILELLTSYVNGELSWEKSVYRIVHLINSKTLAYHHFLFLDIFKELDTDTAKNLAKKSVGTLGLSMSVNTELVYGEIEFLSFASILERVSPKPGQVFVDLGHGTGKALVCAWLLYGNYFSLVHGVELLEDLYLSSVDVVSKAKQITTERGQATQAGLTVCQGDMLVARENSNSCIRGDYFDWGEADIVFANSTCFGEELMAQLSDEAAKRMKSGAIFISLTRNLSGIGDVFVLEGTYQYAMSWGTATCFIQRKL